MNSKVPWVVGLVSAAIFAIGCSVGSEPSGGGTEQGKGSVGVGQPAWDGRFEFVVSGLECGLATIGKDVFEKVAQGQFCILSMTIKNIGDKEQLFDNSSQYLYDKNGKRYSSDTEASFTIQDNDDVFLEDVNPGNQISVKVAYDVPKGTEISKVELHDSSFSRGVEVIL